MLHNDSKQLPASLPRSSARFPTGLQWKDTLTAVRSAAATATGPGAVGRPRQLRAAGHAGHRLRPDQIDTVVATPTAGRVPTIRSTPATVAPSSRNS